MAYPKTFVRLLEALEKLPGVGPKSAERMAFHLLKASPSEALPLADALRDLKTRLKHCSVCCNVTEVEEDPCVVCRDAGRDDALLCVVEQPRDLWALERTGRYRGRYHVLLGRIAPLDRQGPESIALPALMKRLAQGTVREVILATNPDLDGDGTALFIARQIAQQKLPVAVTRLAKGLPSGGSLEFASTAVLTDALEGRRAL